MRSTGMGSKYRPLSPSHHITAHPLLMTQHAIAHLGGRLAEQRDRYVHVGDVLNIRLEREPPVDGRQVPGGVPVGKWVSG